MVEEPHAAGPQPDAHSECTVEAQMFERQRLLLQEWERRNWNSLATHSRAASLFNLLNVLSSVVSIGALVALGVAAAGFDLTVGNNRYVVLILSIVAALAGVVQAIFNFGSRADLHRSASRRHSTIARQALSYWMLRESAEKLKNEISDLEREWQSVSDYAPNVPRWIYDRRRDRRHDTLTLFDSVRTCESDPTT